MKILFSPSEMKSELGSDTRICERNFIFADLYEKRLQMLRAYADFVDKASEAELCKLFGLKKWDAALRENIFEKGCAKAPFALHGYLVLRHRLRVAKRYGAGVCGAKHDNFFKPFRPRAGRRRATELQAQAGRKIWRHRRGEILSR